MFAQIYECPKCGDTWNVALVEVIDTDRDEVWQVPTCNKCGREVSPKQVDGKFVVHMMTPDEAYVDAVENLPEDFEN